MELDSTAYGNRATFGNSSFHRFHQVASESLGHYIGDRLAHNFLSRVAEQGFRSMIPELHVTLSIDRDDGILCARYYRAIFLLGLLQMPVRIPPTKGYVYGSFYLLLLKRLDDIAVGYRLR